MPAIPHAPRPSPCHTARPEASAAHATDGAPAADGACARIGLLGQRLARLGITLATAESCTGGLIAARCTEMPGSSAWFVGGVVAYANAVKRDVLGVDPALLAAHGAVSEPVVRAMAAGVLRLTGAHLAVAVSGVAGPDGGTPEKPVGTVWMAVARGEAVQARRFLFSGDRAAVRAATVDAAVTALLTLYDGQAAPGGPAAP